MGVDSNYTKTLKRQIDVTDDVISNCRNSLLNNIR